MSAWEIQFFLREIRNFFGPIHQRLYPYFCAYFSNGQNGQALIQFEFCIWIELHWDWRSNVLGKRGIVIRMMSLLPGDMALIKPGEPKKKKGLFQLLLVAVQICINYFFRWHLCPHREGFLWCVEDDQIWHKGSGQMKLPLSDPLQPFCKVYSELL